MFKHEKNKLKKENKSKFEMIFQTCNSLNSTSELNQ